MPTTLGKNLHLCFTKLSRSPTDPDHSPAPLTGKKDHNRSSSITTTTTTTSSSSSSSSSSTSTSVLIKNFNSLYDQTPESTSKSLSRSSDYFSSSDSDDETTPPPADFATVYASQRFFFSSPGRTNSIVESIIPESPPESDTLISGGVAIPTYSPDPYMDFRRSMQEMVEARDMLDVTADWDYLHELLLCYLSINPKNAHKFILGAFADLLVTLMTSKSDAPHHRKSDISGRCPVSRRLV